MSEHKYETRKPDNLHLVLPMVNCNQNRISLHHQRSQYVHVYCVELTHLSLEFPIIVTKTSSGISYCSFTCATLEELNARNYCRPNRQRADVPLKALHIKSQYSCIKIAADIEITIVMECQISIVILPYCPVLEKADTSEAMTHDEHDSSYI